MSKKVSAKERIAQQTESLLSTITKTVDTAAREAAKEDSNDPMTQLERLAKDFQEVYVKIEKKQRNGSKFELWTELTLPVDDVINRGTDSICKEQGGGGQYRVRIRAPGDKQSRAVFEHSIAGPPLDQPRSDYDMGLGAFNPLGSLPGFGQLQGGMASPRAGYGSSNNSTSQDPTKLVEAMSKQFNQTLHSQQSASDRNNQLLMTMMMTMMSNNQQTQQRQAPAEDHETRKQLEKMREEMAALQRERERERERFDRLEQERRWEAQMAARDKELAELKNMYQSTQNKSSEKDWLIPLITTMNSSQGQSTQTMIELMKMAQSKPSELEMFGNFIATVSTVMNGQFEGQARLLEVVKDALSGGDEHPIRDAILRGMDGLMNLGSEALQAQAMKAQHVAEAQVVPPQVEPPSALSQEQPLQGLPQHEESEEIEEEGNEEPELLTDEEFERMARDAALQKVIAVMFNGEHPSEASVRLYRHANSGNTIARKWLQWPYEVSEQIFMELLGTTVTASPKGDVDLAEALGDDIMAFDDYLGRGGNADKWAKSGYPLNEKKIRAEDLDPAVRPAQVESSALVKTDEAEEIQAVTVEADKDLETVNSES